MDLLFAAFLLVGVWALARFAVLELVKQAWQKTGALGQLVKAGLLAATERFVSISLVCALSLLGIWLLSWGLRVLGSLTPENAWHWLSVMDTMVAATKTFSSGFSGVMLVLLLVSATWYVWREGQGAIADRVRSHITREYARLVGQKDSRDPSWTELPLTAEMEQLEKLGISGSDPESASRRQLYDYLDIVRRIDKPLDIELVLAPMRGDGGWQRVRDFVLSRGFVSSTKVLRKLMSTIALISLCLSLVWVKSDALASTLNATINDLIVTWENNRTREQLESAADTSSPDIASAPTAEDLEIENFIAHEFVAAMSRDPAFLLKQPSRPEVRTFKPGLRVHLVRAAILEASPTVGTDPYLALKPSLMPAEQLLADLVRPRPLTGTKGDVLFRIPGIKELFPKIREKMRNYRRNFSEPLNFGTLHDVVLGQVVGYVWGITPLETDSSAGKLAKKIVDEFGTTLLRTYFDTKLQRAMVNLVMSPGHYDPSVFSAEQPGEARTVLRSSAEYANQVGMMTELLVDAAQHANGMKQRMATTKNEGRAGIRSRRAQRNNPVFSQPNTGSRTGRESQGSRDLPPNEAFVAYGDVVGRDDRQISDRELAERLSAKRDAHLIERTVYDGLGPDKSLTRDPYRTYRPPPRPRGRKGIAVATDIQNPPWNLHGLTVHLRWARNGKMFTLYARTDVDAQKEQTLGTFNGAVLNSALQFVADGRTLLIVILPVRVGNRELDKILLHPSLEDSRLGCTMARADVAILDTARRHGLDGSSVTRDFGFFGIREQYASTDRTAARSGHYPPEVLKSFRFVAERSSASSSTLVSVDSHSTLSRDIFSGIERATSRNDLVLFDEFMVLQRFFRSALYGPLSARFPLEQLVALANESLRDQESWQTPNWNLATIPKGDVPDWVENENRCGFWPQRAERR